MKPPDADRLSFCPVFYSLHSLSLNICFEKFFSLCSHLEQVFVNPIWTGGMAPLRVFAKYLKNGLADLHETS